MVYKARKKIEELLPHTSAAVNWFCGIGRFMQSRPINLRCSTAPRCSTLRCWHSDPCCFTPNTTLHCWSIFPLLLLQLRCVISLVYARPASQAIATCLQTSPVPSGPVINALCSDA